MSDSIRQQIINALDARLKTITTANGYKTDAGAHVFDWLDRDLADGELDAIEYRDTTDDIESGKAAVNTHKIKVEITAKTKSASTTPAQVRLITDDIYQAIGTDDTWGGLAQDTVPVSAGMDVQRADKIMGEAKIVIVIEYDAAKWTQ